MNDVPADPVSPVDPAGPAEKEAKSSQNLAVLFADIDGSTKLYETHGDETAHRLTAQVLTQLDAQAGIAGGRTVKTSGDGVRSEEHTSELQSLMRISYAVFCLKK